MRRLALGLTLLGLFLLPGLTQALGLGNIEVSSPLNQPLRAQIELVSTRADELVGLDVRLAPDELFQRMGIEREFYLTELIFTPVVRPDGVPVIQVTTKNPVREPFLNFLIEATWPRGRLVREYTVLLDPPATFEEELPPPITPPVAVRRPAEPPVSEPYYAPPPRQPAPPVATRPAAPRPAVPTRSVPDSYRVGDGQTLWSIAEDVRPDAGVTMNQVMIALQRLNPEAFDRGNINLVRSGYVLRVPSREEVSAVSAAQAQREVQHQNAQWRELRAGLAARPVTQPVATPSQVVAPVAPVPVTAPATPAPAAADPQLKILAAPAEDSARAAATARADVETAEVAKIEQELALARETAESRRVENEELSTRVAELEQLLEKKDQLLTLAQDQLADLEKRMARLEGRKPADAGPALPDLSLDALLDNPNLLLMVGGVLLLVLLLVMLLLRRLRNRGDTVKPVKERKEKKSRRKGEKKEEAEADTDAFARGSGFAGAAHGLTVSEVQSEEFSRPTPQAMKVESAVHEPLVEEAPVPAVPAAVMETAADTGKDDVLTEADVYLAYGLYQQAEGLLKNAIAEAPARNDYRLKLLETYFATRDKAAFEAAAQDLHDSLQGDRDDPLWSRAEAMGREVSPESGLFGGKGGVRPAAKAAPAVAAAVAATTAATMASSATVSEPDLSDDDLADLNFSLDIEPEAGAETQPVAGGGLDELDFGSDDQIARLMDESGLSAEVPAEAEFDLGALDNDRNSEVESQPAATGKNAQVEADVFDFDLDAGDEVASSTPSSEPVESSELESMDELDFPLDTAGVGDTSGQIAGVDEEDLGDFELDFMNEAESLTQPSRDVTTTLDDLDLDAFLEKSVDEASGSSEDTASEMDVPAVEADRATDPFETSDVDLLDELGVEADAAVEPVAEPASAAEVDDLEFLKELEAEAAKDEAEALQDTGDIDVLDFGFVGDEGDERDETGTETDASDETAQAFDDFDFGELEADGGNGAEEPNAALSAGDIEDLDFDLDTLTGGADDDALDDLALDFDNDRAGDEGMPLSGDEVATKLDLAKAYIDMEDAESARATLDEVLQEGSETQRREAEELLAQLKG